MPFYDQEIFDLISLEKNVSFIVSLIASENIVSQEVRQAVGSELTNKYAEGYPGKRYYGGCDIHDQIESLAIVRAQKLFSAEHVNVQPHSGSNANMAALFTLAQHGDSILAMDLNHGGHLTHGSRVNFSGKWFNIVGYGVRRDDQHIDYEMVQKLAFEHKPKVIIAGASAYSRTIDFERFRSIADEVGAAFLVDMAHIAGLIATGLHPSPFPHADIVTTTTHKTLRGPRGGMILCKESYAKKVNSWVFPGLQGGPLMHEIAGKAVCFKEALLPSFADYQKQVVANCQRLAEIFLSAGIKLVSGGTDNHLLLLDVTSLGLNGQEAEAALDEIGIVANKNKIPFDEKPATITSGLRLGTASITTRGMGLREIDEIGQIILDRLRNNANSKLLKDKVEKLASKFVA